jgi:hypothetical protein
MYTPTFLQKRFPLRFSWQSVLFSLLLSVSLGLSHLSLAQTFTYDNITISSRTSNTATAATKIYVGRGTLGTGETRYQAADLGSGAFFDQNTGNLEVVATSAVASSPYAVSKVQLLYRVYASGTAVLPAYSAVEMTQNSGANPGASINFSNASSTARIDLLNQSVVLGGGTYVVDILFSGYYDDPDTGENTQFLNPQNSSGIGFTATFKVVSPATTPTGGTTTWQSTNSTDWTVASNWSNGVPTATSNAVIPAKTTGSNIVYPILNNPSAPYNVKNLTLSGTLNSSRALLSIGTATLTIYGDLNQNASGLTGSTTGITGVTDPSQNSTIIFAGANQVITGNLSVSDIVIAGSGTKSVINVLNPTNILVFKPTNPIQGVIVQSASLDNGNGTVEPVFDTTYNTYINLGPAGIISTVDGERETNVSYIKGVSRVTRNLTSGITQNFGNIGLDMNANHDVSSGIIIFRVVGDALTGPTGSTAVPIKRQYQISGDDNSNAPAYSSSTATITFHYLPSADELNGISESNLTMFRTTTGGTPYDPVYGDLNTTNHTVTRADLPSLTPYTVTLGDKTNPLPVVLTAFTATRTNANALLTWQTASERDNKGFEVQVATDGVTYRTLTFVASHASTSAKASDYQYLDTEAGKVGVRYYRLHQLDIDGTDSYSPIRTVSFTDGDAVATTLVAAPNPFTDKLAFSFNGAAPAGGTAKVILIDMAGRTVREQRIALSSASMDLGDLSGLRAGLYVAKIALPDGSAKMVRIQKQ